ncbi:hypothetical protein BRADI_3g08544v3 [Brachypodium distachyon]|uniref:Uncharacterized protein n=1 Tax=Brachypodium distachyon TaxID=15368 RepID=A0A2K2CW07_BRADI|nr:hypothetical protein BRADI_3g08544v3 [Brachypodium distachyon]
MVAPSTVGRCGGKARRKRRGSVRVAPAAPSHVFRAAALTISSLAPTTSPSPPPPATPPTSPHLLLPRRQRLRVQKGHAQLTSEELYPVMNMYLLLRFHSFYNRFWASSFGFSFF